MGDKRFVPDNSAGIVFIRVAVPELKVQKCLQFQLEHTVWQAKQRVLASFAKDLRDALNYGLYLPPANGRAGKFMEEERLLSEYPIQGPIGFLEFKYKRRVYKMMQISERKLKQINSKAKLKTFMEFVRNGNTERTNKLSIKGLDPNFHDPDNGETPLTVAVTLGKSKCREVILALVSGGAHLDFRNRQGLTALHRAAIVGNVEAIRAMLDLGASPDSKDARDLTPLYYSVSNDDAVQECTRMLLHEKARIGICDEHGWYEIHQACKYGRVQHLEHLVFYGADMDVRNSCGNTPLHICALNSQEACARLLLFRGADSSLCNYSNQTAGQAGALAGNLSIAAMINDHIPDDVVPYREIPQYSERRKGSSLTPSLRALLRSRSDPRINMAGLDSRSPSTSSSPFGNLIRRQLAGQDSDSSCSISVASTGSVTGVTDHGMYEGRTMTGREGYFPGGHLSEVNIRRAGSMGDVNNISRAATQRNTLAPLVHVVKEQQPRVVLLHRSPEGYGFVLRGAKSKLPTGGGFNDFTPTADYPALQYLDSVDPGSQADRAGLLAGDFILEINGENVMRSSHEHVVHLIRSSSDVLTLKVVTVTQSDPTPSDWYAFQDYGAMTLPNRKKIAAPLPPQRDPQTSLSYSKASSKSMTEGLAEIEKLDAAIAEFEGQEEARSRSHQGADDHKVASVRASHALKRVSVMDYDGLITGEPGIVAANSKGHVSPAEARIKKYHKRSASQTIERSKSTPDISAAIDQEYNEHSAGSQITGSWTKSRAPPPPPQDGHYIAKDSSPFSGVAFVGTSPYSKNTGTPDSSRRTLGNHQVTSAAPPIPEIVRIHTTGKNSNYGNVSSEIEHRKKMMESPYESSFRPENNKNVIHNADHSALSNKNNLSNQNGDKYISFADERILENAHKFVERYPNATVLVTADIHSDKIDGSKDRVLYEPDPDYEDSDDDKSVFFKTEHQNNSSIARINSKQNRDADDISNVVRQGKSSITVISINNESNRENTKKTSSSHSSPNLANSTKSSPVSIHTQENMSLTSPVQSISSSRRSSGVVMATPSQPSSAESSRRSSIQSNYSGDNVERHGRNFMPSSTSTLIMGNSRDNHQTEVPPPPPPPPPLGAAGKPSSKDANSTVKLRSNEAEAISVLQNRVSTDAILAAVADRRNRLENEGPRLSDVKPLPTSKSSHELNQEALKAAVAMRKSRLEQSEDKSVVDEIEARLNKNKKLQAAKYYGTDANRNSAVAKLEEEVHPMPVPVAAPTISRAEEKPKDVPRFEPPFKPSAQIKLSPVVPVKLNPSTNTSLSEKQTTTTGSPDPTKNIGADFRAKLKPVDVKVTGSPLVGQSKTAVSSSPNVTTPAANVTAIVMTRGNSSKAQAPPPPPPPLPPPAASTGLITTTSSVSKPKPELPALATSKPKPTPVEAKTSSTNPLSPTSPSTNSLASSSDYIALAERARQEYLKKKASGNLQANIEKRGPVEITPNRKNSQRNKPTTPTSPANAPPIPSSKSSGPTLIEVKPNMETNGDNVQISVQDRIKTLQPPEKGLTNGKTNVAGVTEDHSHTEIALSNGTIKKSSPQSKAFPPVNITSGNSSGLGARIAPPPPGFGDSDGSPNYRGGVAIDIIPPPSSFSVAGSPDSALSVPSYGQDDAASFVSSVSSLSTLSSEHGDGFHHSQMNSKDIFAHSPPPPPDFTNSTLGDQDAFIPPPPEFLEIDSNANESKAVDKNTRPFASKPVSDWSCMDVLDWLDSLNLPQYRISFAKAHVDGSKLVIMGRNEFINLGVTQVAHRMNLERSVKKLNMGASTNL